MSADFAFAFAHNSQKLLLLYFLNIMHIKISSSWLGRTMLDVRKYGILVADDLDFAVRAVGWGHGKCLGELWVEPRFPTCTQEPERGTLIWAGLAGSYDSN